MNDSDSKSIGCIQQAAGVLGSKWTGQIIRELADAPRRFCELERALPALNPRTLSKRLDELRDCGIIAPTEDRHGYTLTAKGTDLLPILHEMALWDTKHAAAAALR